MTLMERSIRRSPHKLLVVCSLLSFNVRLQQPLWRRKPKKEFSPVMLPYSIRNFTVAHASAIPYCAQRDVSSSLCEWNVLVRPTKAAQQAKHSFALPCFLLYQRRPTGASLSIHRANSPLPAPSNSNYHYSSSCVPKPCPIYPSQSLANRAASSSTFVVVLAPSGARGIHH